MEFYRYILSYEEALEIVGEYKNTFYFKKEYMIEGYRVVLFSYRFLYDLDTPLPYKPHIKGNEMRGLVFIFDGDGNCTRYLSLDKFYNINQSKLTYYNNIRDLKIKTIMPKEDGSMVSFIRLPNGKVIPKTIEGFDNDQTKMANDIYLNNEKLRKFIDNVLDENKVAIFELVSPRNRIVVEYRYTELVLLRVRDNTTGEYYDISGYDPGTRKSISIDSTLDEMISLTETSKNMEGWVIEFENGLMVKLKTHDYFGKHGLYTEDIYREEYILKLIIENKIDDILSELTDYPEKIEFIGIIKKKVDKFMLSRLTQLDIFLSQYSGNRKEFSIKFNKHELFPMAMEILFYGKDPVDMVKGEIRHISKKLWRTREWLDKIIL